ncbi:MAG: class I SAM-dependent methyltransferase [Betaproteobacteria bacterium]|nr:class I SAM-dependent methyltransferase [Betaproteobacteria bacterium]
MNHLEQNRHSWNAGIMAGSVWAQPVDTQVIAKARAGTWDVWLTPKTPVPKAWLGDVRGKEVLCLASGGGQQVPVFAAAGARVTSFDLSDVQLAKDQAVADRERLDIRCVQGDMADLGALDGESFDLIFHPAANVFVPDLRPVWAGCHRVLRPGGALLAGFMNPALFLFDHEEASRTGELRVKYTLPYADVDQLDAATLVAKREAGDVLEFSHSLTTQIGGQADAGFAITGLFEDHWHDDTWLFSRHAPVSIATRAVRG